MTDADLRAIRGHKLREALAPFDQDQRVAIVQLFEAEGRDLAWLVQAVKIDVIQIGRVLMDERERGAGDVVPIGAHSKSRLD